MQKSLFPHNACAPFYIIVWAHPEIPGSIPTLGLSFLFSSQTAPMWLFYLLANVYGTIQSKLNPSKKNWISKKQKLLKLKGHDPTSNRQTLDHMPNVIPMSYCGRNSNHLIWHDFLKNFKWLKFFQKLSAPKFNIGLSNLVVPSLLPPQKENDDCLRIYCGTDDCKMKLWCRSEVSDSDQFCYSSPQSSICTTPFSMLDLWLFPISQMGRDFGAINRYKSHRARMHMSKA